MTPLKIPPSNTFSIKLPYETTCLIQLCPGFLEKVLIREKFSTSDTLVMPVAIVTAEKPELKPSSSDSLQSGT